MFFSEICAGNQSDIAEDWIHGLSVWRGVVEGGGELATCVCVRGGVGVWGGGGLLMLSSSVLRANVLNDDMHGK